MPNARLPVPPAIALALTCCAEPSSDIARLELSEPERSTPDASARDASARDASARDASARDASARDPSAPAAPMNGRAPASEPRSPSVNEPPPVTEPLPDLVLDRAYLIDTLAVDEVRVDDACLLAEGCVTGLGERTVVRFGSRTGNAGEADFVLGEPNEKNPLWTRDSCQESFDLVGFGRYELIDPESGARVVHGGKNGFCIADAEAWDPESGQRCEVYDCGYQGISPGCADNYGAELQCQWVDVTGVAPGVYDLRVTINADRKIAESDYANNTVLVRVGIANGAVSVE